MHDHDGLRVRQDGRLEDLAGMHRRTVKASDGGHVDVHDSPGRVEVQDGEYLAVILGQTFPYDFKGNVRVADGTGAVERTLPDESDSDHVNL